MSAYSQLAGFRNQVVVVPLNDVPLNLFATYEIAEFELAVAAAHARLPEPEVLIPIFESSEFRTWALGNDNCQHLLGDEIAQYLTPDVKSGSTNYKGHSEMAGLLVALETAPEVALASDQAFVGFIERIHQVVEADKPGFRTGSMTTVQDARGNMASFPGITEGLEHLKSICSDLSTAALEFPATVGVILMLYISIIHPFRDGNGRVGRILYNWSVCSKLGIRNMLPIKVLANCSNGGDIIKQRRASHHNDWMPMIGQIQSYYCIIEQYLGLVVRDR